MVRAKKSKFEPPCIIYFCSYNSVGDFRIIGDGFGFVLRFGDITFPYMQSAQSDLVDFLDSLFDSYKVDLSKNIKVVLDLYKSDHYFCLMEKENFIEFAKFPLSKLAPFYYAPVVRFFVHLLSDDERLSIFRNSVGDGNVDDYIKPLHQNEM